MSPCQSNNKKAGIMINIGFDFGMTNSTICFYDKESKALECFKSHAGAASYIPTVISYGKKRKIGRAAKNEAGKAEVYSGFKLQLGSGFHAVSEGMKKSPGEAAGDYIKMLLELFEKEAGEIGQIVMTIPEAWYREQTNVAARDNLKALFEKIGRHKVRFQSEPVAAAAYYCWNQKKEAGKNGEEANLLVVDYGGGTLDVTLCEIKKNNIVRVVDSCGIGEDMNRKGCGGTAFDKEVIDILCQEHGLAYTEQELQIAVNELERLLIDDEESCSELMNEYYLFPEGLEDEAVFALHSLGGAEVCCRHLKQAFDKVNMPALKKAIDWMKENHDLSSPDLKIALVGGFSKFCCVETAVRELLSGRAGTMDSRFVGLFSGENRAVAVAKGAALIAEGQIAVEPVFPYELGMLMGRMDVDFRYHDEDVPLILKGADTNEYVQPIYVDKAAKVCFTDLEHIFARMYMKNGKEKVVFALDDAVKDIFPMEKNKDVFYLGISVDPDMIPVLWIKNELGEENSYPLNRILEKVLITKRG